ncbi:unnamed protein product [Rhodiola kirilowii]
MASSSSSSGGRGPTILDHTNFERFLDSVTPCLHLHSIPPGRVHGVDSNSVVVDEPVSYFKLADLWQGFDQASAYGVGTRVLLDDGDVVTQYYTPYLSAIQLYTNKPYPSASAEVVRCDSDNSWSDDNESEKVSRSMSDNSSPTWEDHSHLTTDRSDKRGHVYLSYCEFASPFWRIPFYDKIMEFAQTRPELMTLTSLDLSPSSWLAILWYPIYNIPSQKRSKDLSTIFLTFYTLSSSFLGDQQTSDKGRTPAIKIFQQKKSKEAKNEMIYLRPFGLSTFKLSGNTWTMKESDVQKMSSLQTAADSWLKDLNFSHHDFSFYLNQSAEVHK